MVTKKDLDDAIESLLKNICNKLDDASKAQSLISNQIKDNIVLINKKIDDSFAGVNDKVSFLEKKVIDLEKRMVINYQYLQAYWKVCNVCCTLPLASGSTMYACDGCDRDAIA